MRPGGPEPVVDRSDAVPVRRGRRWWRWAAPAATALLALALALWWLAPSAPPPLTQADVDRAVQRGVEQAEQERAAAPPEGSAAFQAISPSLVSVAAQRQGQAPGAPGTTGLGSGVVINAGGAVLTALHVVDGAQRVQVQFADGTVSDAHVVAAQPEHDVAVLAAAQLPELVVPAVLATPPPVGGHVYAVGNPLGLERSVTAGVVSATDRAIRPDQGPTLSGLIQFDAAVNPGNSGGPLLNGAGQVVGVVTGLANPARQGFFVGIGFAVPIATATGGAGGPQQ